MSDVAAANIFNDLFRRLRLSLGVGRGAILGHAAARSRGHCAGRALPDRHAWQVGLTLLVPLLLLAAVLLLEAGTMRSFFDEDEQARAVRLGRAHAAGLGCGCLGLHGRFWTGATIRSPSGRAI